MIKFNQVGEAVPMPGVPGFTMVVFKAEDVSAGEVVYVCSEKGKGSPWYPPEDPEFGPWIDFYGVVCPIDPYSVCELFLVSEQKENRFTRCKGKASGWRWDDGDIVAYRIKK